MRTSQPDLERFERAVIGAVLANNNLLDDLGLVANDFSTPRRQRLYEAILSIVASGGRATLITVSNAVGDGKEVLPELESYLDISAEAEQAAVIVKKESRLRRLQMLSLMITESLSRIDPEEITDMVTREVEAIDGADTSEIKTTDQLMPAVIELVEQLWKNRGSILGVKTGFPSLNSFTGGFQRGEYIVIAARPGIGKTEFIISMIIAQMRLGIRAGIFSAEMAATRMLLRMLCTAGGMSFTRVREGGLQRIDFARMKESGDELARSRIFLDDTAAIAFSELRSKARRMVKLGAQVLYVDYLTLVRYGDARMPRHERVGELSKGFQRLARELNVPLVVISQINRAGEGIQPTLDMLRQSGEIEEDADVIMFLHRKRNSTHTDLIIAKSRDGGNGLVELIYLPERSLYVERSNERDETT